MRRKRKWLQGHIKTHIMKGCENSLTLYGKLLHWTVLISIISFKSVIYGITWPAQLHMLYSRYRLYKKYEDVKYFIPTAVPFVDNGEWDVHFIYQHEKYTDHCEIYKKGMQKYSEI